MIAGTKAFADAYTADDDAKARELYPDVRVHWERIEPVAESFGDLDPLLDAREADLAEGDTWSGWHYLEKDLWPPTPEANGGTTYEAMTPAERTAAAADLVSWTERLVTQVNAEDFTFEAFQISNGAKELLDEVASGKVTGEEEIWSQTTCGTSRRTSTVHGSPSRSCATWPKRRIPSSWGHWSPSTS